MTMFSGRAYESSFITTLVDHLTGIPVGGTEPYWKQVNSGSFTTEGVILESKGSGGDDNIFVQIKKSTNYSIIVRLLHNYIPSPISGLDGTFLSATPEQNVYWYNTTYPATTPFDYWLSFDRDRIMLFVGADKLVVSPTWGDLVWIGVPSRVSKESDSTAATIAVSRYSLPLSGYGTNNNHTGNYGICTTVKSINKSWNVKSSMITSVPFKSVGWGGHVNMPLIYLDNGEGVRSIMHGVHPLSQVTKDSDFKHGDEIMVGSKRYTIFQTHYAPGNTDANCFPTDWMAVEQLR